MFENQNLKDEQEKLRKKSLILMLKVNINIGLDKQMGLVARKPVAGVSYKVSFRPVSSATETM